MIVVDHGSRDETVKVAKEHGAKVINAVPGVDRGAYAQDARNQWILCLLPHEAVAEELEASLLEWTDAEQEPARWASIWPSASRTAQAGSRLMPELRLANRKQINWTGDLPPDNPKAPALAGHISAFLMGTDVLEIW